MTITSKDLKLLLQKSGNRCAFPNCGELLIHADSDNIDEQTVLSNIAHIVAQKGDGPRGHYALPLEERDRENNLLLLCEKHHKIIDDQPQRYTVERLRQFKEDHEKRIEELTGMVSSKQLETIQYVTERLYSNLFEVIEMPAHIYCAPSKLHQSQINEIRQAIVPPKDKNEIYPFIVREGNLYSFQNLKYGGGPFQHVVDTEKSRSIRAYDFWNDPIKTLWFLDLLNQTLNKLTGRKGLMWDKEHKRYYFQPDKPGEIKEVEYRPLNQAKSTKQVVWQPLKKSTNEPHPYWLHRAVNLRFHQVNQSQWCLSIRPEFRVTKNGFEPLDSEKIGGKVTRKKSRMFNYDLLGEINFWRDFLCGSEPRIILSFGKGQQLIVSSNMLQTDVQWPGMPERYAKPFTNVEYQEDLFSWAKLANLKIDADEDEEFLSEEEGEDYDDE
ncbi:MAG: hypothetical protein HY865_20440 [Chloroflexi bacterium]|nr:hypothetical protein [Chloroflexota bacterium]